ncbi:hypothetical protein C2L65_42435 [Paraburkholderia terrae]|uniref:Uncharacterized protein n=1 Tax=Paraburkholderia terrae TaxID=311230 RepID=A0A2I8F499_9BURK|nr:hypothetical protein C2L65_42435 [Paraburkholderia terrae]
MELWIQPCAPCADLYGRPSSVDPHDTLTLIGASAVKDAQLEQRYSCTRCCAAFARIFRGEPRKQIWMLLNAGQH